MKYEVAFISLIINCALCLLKSDFPLESATSMPVKVNNSLKNSNRKTIDIINVVKEISRSKPYSTKKPLLISKARKCIENLKLEDKINNFTAKNWSCKIVNQKKVKDIPLLCSCSYDLQCDESERIFFSSDFNQNLMSQNKLKNVYRGADFQCENYLINKTNKKWLCQIKQNLNATKLEEENYCDCLSKNVCKSERLVEFY